MKVAVGVYESHEKAISALKELQKSGFLPNQLSVIGKAELVDNHLSLKAKDTIERAEVGIGAVSGTTLGILTGIGVFAIPGLGLLYGAGAFLGALAGLWGGIVTGSMVDLLTTYLGLDEATATRFEKHIKEGKFIVSVQGDEKQIKKAHQILHTHGLAIELKTN